MRSTARFSSSTETPSHTPGTCGWSGIRMRFLAVAGSSMSTAAARRRIASIRPTFER